MKPLHIALLVAAGAVGGAVVMKMMQPGPAPVPVAAQAPVAATPAPPAAPATPAEQGIAPAPTPSPFPEKKPASHESAARHRASKPTSEELPAIAQVQTPSTPAAAPAPAVQPEQPAPTPVKEPEPQAPPAPPPPPPPQTVTLQPGTLIQVRVIDGLSSDRSMPGDQFAGTLAEPVAADGFVIAERGARVEGRVVASDKGGRVKGVSSLAVELTRLHTSDGQTVALNTDAFQKLGESSKKTDAAKIGAGAAIGAAIGAIAGGGKGAAIGAGVGGGAGAGDVLLTHGKPATIPSETRISFRLREAVTLTERGR